jgi:hypothetical protein
LLDFPTITHILYTEGFLSDPLALIAFKRNSAAF